MNFSFAIISIMIISIMIISIILVLIIGEQKDSAKSDALICKL